MDNFCSKCGSSIRIFGNVFASKLLPVKCLKCGCKSYRKHSISYYFATVFFSLGLIALLFLAMSQGFTFALNAAIVGFFLLIAIYIGELLLVGLEFFSPSIENENAIAGKKNSLIALIFVILSVLLYLVTDG